MKVTDAFYAAIGAPVLASRKLVEVGGKAVVAVRDGVEASAIEGRTVADRLGDGQMVEELGTRLEVDERVGRLRDQVEGVVERWREGFQADKNAATKQPDKKAVKKAATKPPAAKKAAAKKTPAKSTAKKSTTKKATTPKATTTKAKVGVTT